MSAYRNTQYAPDREADKPAGGWAKSMHGDSLKPGDVVYGPALGENARGEVTVMPQHWGIVADSQGDSVKVVYATSEKSYNIAHQQSFTAEDKALSNGMAKDGHWSRSDFYVVPSELLERRGFVSDKTWQRVEMAAATAARSGAGTHMPAMDRDGTVYNTAQRETGRWTGIDAALAQSAAERSGAAMAGSSKVLGDEERAVLGAKSEAVGFIQELLKSDGSSPSVTYDAKAAAELTQKILESPDSMHVVLTPQDKLRIVTLEQAKAKGWESMSVGEARELIEGQIAAAKDQVSAEKQTSTTLAPEPPSSAAPRNESPRAAEPERER